MQERKFIRDQEHERAMFLHKLDFHRRRAIRQVHSANKTGSGHWPRAMDRTHNDQKPDHQEKEGQRQLLGQQGVRQAHHRQQRRGGAEAPACNDLPAINKRNPAPAKKNRRKRKPTTGYSTTVTTFTPTGPVRRFWNWRAQKWEELDPSSSDRNIETIDLAGDDEGRKTPDNPEHPPHAEEIRERPQKGAGQNPRRDGPQDEGDVLPADQERINAARRALFTYRQPIVVNDEPDPKQGADDNAAQSASDEYATAESQVGGAEPHNQQHHDGESAEEHNDNAGVHFWGDTESEDEEDGFSCGLPEIDDWPNDHYTPCQEARLSNTITHAMRFIMVKDDNNLCDICLLYTSPSPRDS